MTVTEETHVPGAEDESAKRAAEAALGDVTTDEHSVPVLAETGSYDLAPVQEQTLVLNMGPQHPSTHGVARVLLELDGETVKKAVPDIGYLHRGVEKIGEYRQYNQFVPWTDRMDYVAAFTSNLSFVQVVEEMMGLEIPPRAK
jgi:NADH:ubiquinone oxidoreductase subunit D